MKKILALCIVAGSITFLYGNVEQDNSEDVTRRVCGSGICCPISQACPTALPIVSLAGSFSFTAAGDEFITVTCGVPTQGACFTITCSGDTITVMFTRPFSIAPVVLAQRLSGTSSIAISNVTNFGFTITILAVGQSSDTISFIAQQACL
jgi:hypothetical protein